MRTNGLLRDWRSDFNYLLGGAPVLLRELYHRQTYIKNCVPGVCDDFSFSSGAPSGFTAFSVTQATNSTPGNGFGQYSVYLRAVEVSDVQERLKGIPRHGGPTFKNGASPKQDPGGPFNFHAAK